jgi:hypothetical protein
MPVFDGQDGKMENMFRCGLPRGVNKKPEESANDNSQTGRTGLGNGNGGIRN